MLSACACAGQRAHYTGSPGLDLRVGVCEGARGLWRLVCSVRGQLIPERSNKLANEVNKKVHITGIHVGAARVLLRITQSDLASLAGVAEATIKRFEAGLHTPRPSTLKAIRDALEARGIEFMNGDRPGVRLWPERAVVN